jgi:hypothetical protein
MLCCAASFVTAAYYYVRLIPQDLRALPADVLRTLLDFELFTSSSKPAHNKIIVTVSHGIHFLELAKAVLCHGRMVLIERMNS